MSCDAWNKFKLARYGLSGYTIQNQNSFVEVDGNMLFDDGSVEVQMWEANLQGNNHNLNQHFFDFVNEYRIKKAMEILADASKNHLTVLEILYEVGFNSKSSFNTAFKKYTKQTPTEYRKQYSS